MATFLCDFIVWMCFLVSSHVVTGQEQPSSNGSATTCLPVPHVFPPHYVINVSQVTELLVGKPWYSYQAYYKVVDGDDSDGQPLTLANAVSNFRIMEGSRKFQGNTEPEIMIQEQTARGQDGCVNTVGLLQYSGEGHLVGPTFLVYSRNGTALPETEHEVQESVIWSTDMSTYILFHTCTRRNLTAGNCGYLGLDVITNIKPNLLSDTQQRAIATAVDSILKPYCLASSKSETFRWIDSLAECPRLDPKKYPEPLANAFQEYESNIKKNSVSAKAEVLLSLTCIIATFAIYYAVKF